MLKSNCEMLTPKLSVNSVGKCRVRVTQGCIDNLRICTSFYIGFAILLTIQRMLDYVNPEETLVIFGLSGTVKPDVLFRGTLQTSAATLVFWLTTCSEQFATAAIMHRLCPVKNYKKSRWTLNQQIDQAKQGYRLLDETKWNICSIKSQ